MAKILGIVNNKGGVGKTTSTAFIGEILALFGNKVLLVDTDESGNLSVLYNQYQEDSKNVLNGIEPPEKLNVAEIFRLRYKEKEDVKKCIYQINENMDIIPCSKRFNAVPDMLLLQSKTNNLNNNIILKRALRTIESDYDYIIIDTAPRNDILIVNCLMAADYITVPVKTESFSLKGFNEVLTELNNLKEEFDITAEFLGAFQTAAEKTTNIYKGLEAEYKELLGDKALPSIRKDTKVNEVLSGCGKSLIEYTSSANVLYDYCMLLIAMGIVDDQTVALIRKAYNE